MAQLRKRQPEKINILSDRISIGLAGEEFTIPSSDIDVELQASIGLGSSSDVYGGTVRRKNMPPKKVVVKVIRCSIPTPNMDRLQRRLIRESFVWSRIKHPNISVFHGLVHLDTFPVPALVSDFVQHDVMGYTEKHMDQRLQLVQQIAVGLQYLHENEIIHGDLKHDNIRVSVDGLVKINDFGLSSLDMVSGFTSTLYGRHPRYVAPELLRSTPEQDLAPRPTFKSDVFAFGISMVQILHGRDRVDPSNELSWDRSTPYNHVTSDGWKDLWDLHKGVISGTERPRLENYRNITGEQKPLLALCWKEPPEERPSMADIVEKIGCQKPTSK